MTHICVTNPKMAAICPELSALDPDEFHFNQWEWLFGNISQAPRLHR